MTPTDWFLLQVLHRGRTNRLSLVRDRISGRHCVLKQTSTEMPIHRLLIEHEMSMHRRLKHRNIIEFISPGPDGSFLMEYAVGGTLRQHRYSSQTPWKELLRHLRHTLEALVYIHQMGIVHNDIKPENILIADSDRAKLCDFALAGWIDQAFPIELPDSIILGSAGYMPKKRLGDHHSTVQNDLYAFGVMLEELTRPMEHSIADDYPEILALSAECRDSGLSSAQALLTRLSPFGQEP